MKEGEQQECSCDGGGVEKPVVVEMGGAGLVLSKSSDNPPSTKSILRSSWFCTNSNFCSIAINRMWLFLDAVERRFDLLELSEAESSTTVRRKENYE